MVKPLLSIGPVEHMLCGPNFNPARPMNLAQLCQAMTGAQAALNEFTEDHDTRHRVLKVLQVAEDNGVTLTPETLADELADLEVAEEVSTETET